MQDKVKGIIYEELYSRGIELCSPLPFSACRVTRGYLLERAGIASPQTVYIAAIPYYSRACDLQRTVSAYAVARDYHIYIKELGDALVSHLSQEVPEYGYAAFGDHSPIDERSAAARAGIGIIGQNGLLITEKYSSFVFLFELITDAPTPDCEIFDIRYCERCGACLAACPQGELECLSAITQKKGELTAPEVDLISRGGSAWGCDICQAVCPHTRRAIASGDIYTPIGFFNKNTLPSPSEADIADETEFSLRAYSWRGRAPIMRNLAIISQVGKKK